MLGALKVPRPGSGLVIAVLALVLLGAIAAEIPAAPIQGGVGGLLVGHSSFSADMAETAAVSGYGALVLELTGARLRGPDLFWLDHLDQVQQRRFPVWGWIDGRTDLDRAADIVRSLPLAGLYVYDATALADSLAGLKQGFPVVSVVPFARRAQHPDAAVAMDYETFLEHAGSVARAVLVADRLDEAKIRRAREVADDCIVALAPIGK